MLSSATACGVTSKHLSDGEFSNVANELLQETCTIGPEDTIQQKPSYACSVNHNYSLNYVRITGIFILLAT
jgi:hypothetical protein